MCPRDQAICADRRPGALRTSTRVAGLPRWATREGIRPRRVTRRCRFVLLALASSACGPSPEPRSPAAPPPVTLTASGSSDGSLTMTSGGRYLGVVLEGDALAHFELGHGDPPRGAIPTSP